MEFTMKELDSNSILDYESQDSPVSDIFGSEEWVDDFKPNHIEIKYSPVEIFPTSISNESLDLLTEDVMTTDYFTNISISPDLLDEYDFSIIEQKADEKDIYQEGLNHSIPNLVQTSPVDVTFIEPQHLSSRIKSSLVERRDSNTEKKSREVKPTQSSSLTATPISQNEIKQYVEPTDLDILSRRGAKSNENVQVLPVDVTSIEPQHLSSTINSSLVERRDFNTEKKSPEVKPTQSSSLTATPLSQNEIKQYVEPTNLDILCGRGAKSNEHKGNKRYLRDLENLKPYYRIRRKDEKTIMSHIFVHRVHAYGGRFLKKDAKTGKWYEVSDEIAWKKISQAFRDDNTPQSRAAKRERYKKKRKKHDMK